MKKLSYRERRRPSRASVFFFLLAVMFVGANYLLADKAHAAHDPEMTVEFQRLELERSGGLLQLDYVVEREDWREMRRRGIEPQLNLYVRERGRRAGFEFAYSVPLKRRRGTIAYPRGVKLRGTKVVELEVVGFSGFDRVTRTRYGDACDGRVRLRLSHREHHGERHDHDDEKRRKAKRAHRHFDTAAVIRLCKANSKSTDVTACMKRARELPRHVDAAKTIEACGEATHWASEFNDCMELAEGFRQEPAPVIRACSASTHWNSELEDCMKKTASYVRSEPATVVAACSAVTHWNSEFVSCLESGDRLGANPASTIRACADATHWNSEFESCLQASAIPTRRPNPA